MDLAESYSRLRHFKWIVVVLCPDHIMYWVILRPWTELRPIRESWRRKTIREILTSARLQRSLGNGLSPDCIIVTVFIMFPVVLVLCSHP
ncbi:hypothetical protein B0H13DRAFT_2022688 [Mycena leptocephala]|nr:hypothetical protein B0H13DRAFT_2022688 [Mycena leptocephala]